MQDCPPTTTQPVADKVERSELLLVTRNLPPLVGGMETLIHRAALILGERYQLTVVGPKGCRDHLPPHIRCLEVPASLPGFLLQAPLACLAASRERRFALAIGGSGLAAVCLWLLSRWRGMATACFVHGLDLVVDNGLYQRLFLPALRRVDCIIANSANTRRLALEKGLVPERVTVLHPGCETTACDRDTARQFVLERCQAEAGMVLLSAGRIVPRKGLLAFVEQGFAALLAKRPDTILVVVGDSPQDSLAHRNRELAALVALVESRGWSEHVYFLGKVDADTLARCYAGADALVFPLVPVAGDVEGFGMVAIEAAAQGTPTFAFAEGGVVDAVADGANGRLFDSGDYAGMASALAELVPGADAAASRLHAKKFGWDVFEAGLLDRLGKLTAGTNHVA